MALQVLVGECLGRARQQRSGVVVQHVDVVLGEDAGDDGADLVGVGNVELHGVDAGGGRELRGLCEVARRGNHGPAPRREELRGCLADAGGGASNKDRVHGE